MRKELVFSIEDLRRAAIACRQCGTSVVLDAAAGHASVAFIPHSCPGCQRLYDPAALAALDDLQRACAALSKLKGPSGSIVSFRAERADD